VSVSPVGLMGLLVGLTAARWNSRSGCSSSGGTHLLLISPVALPVKSAYNRGFTGRRETATEVSPGDKAGCRSGSTNAIPRVVEQAGLQIPSGPQIPRQLGPLGRAYSSLDPSGGQGYNRPHNRKLL